MPRKGLNPGHLVVGLGNPGPEYAGTRHNAGFRVVERLAEDFGIPLAHERCQALFGSGSIRGVAVVLAKPMAFMNRSGPPVKGLIDFLGISSGRTVVIHDDLDLALGRLKIKEKGGHGGHKGVRSLMDAVGGGDFIRVRIGIGRSRLPDGLQPASAILTGLSGAVSHFRRWWSGPRTRPPGPMRSSCWRPMRSST